VTAIIDPAAERAEAFGERMMDMLNTSSLAVMISLGHRTGLLDALGTLPPSTSEGIATATGLNERYIREWLGAMVTGDIVEYNPQDKTYFLPREYAPMLTRDGGADNAAPLMQYITYMGAVEDRLIDCFNNGGGLWYDEFPRFHELMEGDSGQSVLPALIDIILPAVPGLPDRLSKGIDVLDVGCGRGRAVNLMAAHYPNSRFVGFDISAEAVEYAREYARKEGLTNVEFRVGDAATYVEPGKYDLIATFDAIHDQKDPAAVLANIAASLKPDGTYLMQDIRSSVHLERNKEIQPISPTLYAISLAHRMTVSLAVGGAGLGTMWGEEKAREMLGEAGFANVDKHEFEHDFQNNWYVVTK
jgi:2-polyprenyl-3-methyl-5-hydroxy-6-metoxy-1,4-benzoquinol methylase